MEFEEVLAELDIGASELHSWIEQNWVLPVREQDSFFFDEADVARVRLIAELRSDMGVNDDAIPVVLRLLDQIYSLRRALSDLNDAIAVLPEDVQEQLRDSLVDRSDNADSRHEQG